MHNPPGKRILNSQNNLGSKKDPNIVFVTMFLTTTISHVAAKRAFSEFGEMHTVFAATYGDKQFKGICNGKSHVRATPTPSKQDLPHKIRFEENGRFFHVMWAEKIFFC